MKPLAIRGTLNLFALQRLCRSEYDNDANGTNQESLAGHDIFWISLSFALNSGMVSAQNQLLGP